MPVPFTIEGKQLGSRRPLFPEQSFELPSEFSLVAGQITLRQLITQIVRQEVATFRQRQAERSLFRVLTETAIAAGARQGKIDPAGHETQLVDEEAAVLTALQALEDGLYYVFVDGVQQESLDAPVDMRPHSKLTFIRLMALAGG